MPSRSTCCPASTYAFTGAPDGDVDGNPQLARQEQEAQDGDGRGRTEAGLQGMVGRRAEAADIRTSIGCHSFRATSITEYLNGGKLEIAQQMANHESVRTTGLYDRRTDQVNLDEVERRLI